MLFQRLYAIAALRYLVLGYPPNQLRLAQLSEVSFIVHTSLLVYMHINSKI